MKKWAAFNKRKAGEGPALDSTADGAAQVAEKRDFARAYREFYGQNGDRSAAAPKPPPGMVQFGGNRNYPLDDTDEETGGPLSDTRRIERRAGSMRVNREMGVREPQVYAPRANSPYAPTKFTPVGQERRSDFEVRKHNLRKFNPKILWSPPGRSR